MKLKNKNKKYGTKKEAELGTGFETYAEILAMNSLKFKLKNKNKKYGTKKEAEVGTGFETYAEILAMNSLKFKLKNKNKKYGTKKEAAEAGTGFETYAEAAQATLTDLRPEQMEASLPGGDEGEDLGRVETADGIFEDGPEKEEEDEGDEEEDGGLFPGEGEGEADLRYTGESM